MTTNKTKKLLALVVLVLAVLLLALGVINIPGQNGAAGKSVLADARIKALLTHTADQLGVGTDTYSGKSTSGLKGATDKYMEVLEAYGSLEEEATAKYIEEHYEEAKAALEAEQQKLLEEGKEVPENQEVEVDMSGFEPTAEMLAAQEKADEAFKSVKSELKGLFPSADDASLDNQKEGIQKLLYQTDDDFSSQFNRYKDVSGTKLGLKEYLLVHADDILYGGIALLFLVALLLYSEWLIGKLGIPRVIIGMFFILLCFMTLWYDLSLPSLLSNTVVRMGMNAIMVLAMVPGIQCGISLNLGLPIGLVAGLIGGLLTIELEIPGVAGFLFAILVGVVIAIISGYLYAQLLNRLKGEEMSVTTYVGFSIVSLMCIAWLVLPFKSLKLRWPLGTGLRNTIGLDKTNFKHILNDFGAFSIGDFTVPTGLLLFVALCCFLVWLFSRSKTGVAMQAVGNNPRFAEAAGINVNKMRVIGTVLSTVLGAIGILVFSQSYGFMQLYTAPRQMGFVAASAILIGGATTSRCKISHVLIGTFLFQGVLTLGMPVANVLVPGSTISETLRILISNGIILYALTKSGGDSRA